MFFTDPLQANTILLLLLHLAVITTSIRKKLWKMLRNNLMLKTIITKDRWFKLEQDFMYINHFIWHIHLVWLKWFKHSTFVIFSNRNDLFHCSNRLNKTDLCSMLKNWNKSHFTIKIVFVTFCNATINYHTVS